MDSERWKQVNDILQSALDRAPAQRDAFLKSACAGDQALEREVRSLLKSDERAGGFLQNAAIEVAARAMARGLLSPPSRDRQGVGPPELPPARPTEPRPSGSRFAPPSHRAATVRESVPPSLPSVPAPPNRDRQGVGCLRRPHRAATVRESVPRAWIVPPNRDRQGVGCPVPHRTATVRESVAPRLTEPRPSGSRSPRACLRSP